MIRYGGLVLSESSLDIGEDGSGLFTVKLASARWLMCRCRSRRVTRLRCR